MGNSNSISQNDFNDQLTSSCLWSLRKNEIIEYYNKKKYDMYHHNLIEHNINNITNEDIPYLYKSNNKVLSDYSEYNFSTDYYLDDKNIISNMIEKYLIFLMENKDETNKLIMEITNKLSSKSHNNSILINNSDNNSDNNSYLINTDFINNITQNGKATSTYNEDDSIELYE
jgi:hypothetical protein